MDNGLAQFVKKPGVIAVGVVLGVGLLILAARNGSSGGASSNVGATLQSQAIASGANVSLSGQTTQYNIAALNYMSTLAGNAAAMHATDVNATTAIELHSLSNLDNLGASAAQSDLVRQQIAGGIAIDRANNAAMLSAAQLSASTAITLAPVNAAMTENLARIGGANAVALAQVNTGAATTIAQINAASRQSVANTQQGTALGSAAISAAPAILSAIEMFAGA